MAGVVDQGVEARLAEIERKLEQLCRDRDERSAHESDVLAYEARSLRRDSQRRTNEALLESGYGDLTWRHLEVLRRERVTAAAEELAYLEDAWLMKPGTTERKCSDAR